MKKSTSTRPRTLREVSRRVAFDEQEFDPALREFLDIFYANPALRTAGIVQTPLPLGRVKDAYLAAVAEHLARSNGLAVPAWSDDDSRCLSQPFFAGGLESLKALLTLESPAAFRRRLIFVSKDALSRPRSPEPATGETSVTP